MKKKFTHILIVFLIFSCGTVKKRGIVSVLDSKMKAKQIIKTHQRQKADFSTLQARLKLELTEDNKSQTHILTLRMERGKTIWANAFLNMVRLKITPEKVLMYNKLNRTVFEGDYENQRESVYYHYYEWPIWHKVQPHYGIRTDRYKLMHFYYSMDEWELYDLEADPNEMNNIYSEAPKELIEELKKELNVLRKEYKDDGSLEQMRRMTDTVIRRVYNEPNKVMK